MDVEVRPHGRDVERRFREFEAAGVPWSEASERATSVTVDWPSALRLPVPGDSLHLEDEELAGPVERVTFVRDARGKWAVQIKLG